MLTTIFGDKIFPKLKASPLPDRNFMHSTNVRHCRKKHLLRGFFTPNA